MTTPPSPWVPPTTPPPGQPGYPAGWPAQPPMPPMRLIPVAPNGAPLADFWYRLGAYVIDAVILGAVSAIVMIPAIFAWVAYVINQADTTSTYGGEPQPPSPAIFLVFFAIYGGIFLFIMLLWYLYTVEYQLRKGQTIGKKVLKIKIVPVDPTAAGVTRGDLTKRWAVFNVVGVIVPFFSYLDGLWQLWDKPLQQCLHDKAAKTVVIRVG